MRSTLVELLNEGGNSAVNHGHHRLAKILYRAATKVYPTWSNPWYNLGLQAKYRGDWQASLRYNAQAALLAPEDEASWWNLGIAATALRDWSEARRAWQKCGINVGEEDGEITIAPVTACVRINPSGAGEVVWGTRFDPARIRIRNVPLPQSKRRYGDILLNDGAENGTRTSNGHSYPVFDELAVWRESSHSTFRVTIQFSEETAEESLSELCRANDIGLEDWSTVRILCAECSRGNPGAHECAQQPDSIDGKSYGFAATSREALVDILRRWKAEQADAAFSEPQLALLASSV